MRSDPDGAANAVRATPIQIAILALRLASQLRLRLSIGRKHLSEFFKRGWSWQKLISTDPASKQGGEFEIGADAVQMNDLKCPI